MSDWEYWVEQNEAEHAYVDHDPHRRSLSCYVDSEDDIEDEVWSWHPGHRVRGWLTRVHQDLHIGSEVFFASAIDLIDDDSERTEARPESRDIRVIGNVVCRLVDSEKQASYDVICIPRKDLKRLEAQAVRLRASAANMMDEYFAEMLGEMASFMVEHTTVKSFVFFREI